MRPKAAASSESGSPWGIDRAGGKKLALEFSGQQWAVIMKNFSAVTYAILVALAPALLLAAEPSAAPVKVQERDLIGAWRLVYTEMKTLDGRTFPNPTYGPNPHGYLMYDASHTMCVFLAVGVEPGPAPAEFQKLRTANPAAYCGLWYLEPSGEAVIHDIEVSDARSGIGGKQRRRAVVNGDTLIIRSGLQQGLQDYFLRFERVRQNAAPTP
jgi:hypothetical protein